MKKVRLTESELKSEISKLESQLKKLTEGKRRTPLYEKKDELKNLILDKLPKEYNGSLKKIKALAKYMGATTVSGSRGGSLIVNNEVLWQVLDGKLIIRPTGDLIWELTGNIKKWNINAIIKHAKIINKISTITKKTQIAFEIYGSNEKGWHVEFTVSDRDASQSELQEENDYDIFQLKKILKQNDLKFHIDDFTKNTTVKDNNSISWSATFPKLF